MAQEQTYEVQYKLSTDNTWSTLDAGQDVTTHTFSSLSPETKFDYRVRAIGDGINNSNSVWSNVLSVTTYRAVLNAPAAFILASNCGDSWVFTWTDTNTEEGGYEIEYRESGSTTWILGTATFPDAVKATVDGVTHTLEYEVRARAVGYDSSVKDSDYTSIITIPVTTRLNTATDLQGTSGTTGEVSLLWGDVNASPNESGIQIWNKLTAEDESLWRQKTTLAPNTTNWVNSTYTSGESWDFKLRFEGDDTTTSCSEFSNIVTVIID